MGKTFIVLPLDMTTSGRFVFEKLKWREWDKIKKIQIKIKGKIYRG